jgi:excinuclease UvrABC helicase subunit UvrB
MTISDKRKLYNKEYKAEYKDRVHRVTVGFNKAEYEDIEKRAIKEGVKPTTLVRNMTIAYHQQTPIVPESIKEELQELRFLLRNVANNINQIAHHSNTIQRLADENGLLLEIQKMEKTIHDFVMQKLKK